MLGTGPGAGAPVESTAPAGTGPDGGALDPEGR
jgi:hypothetical protein